VSVTNTRRTLSATHPITEYAPPAIGPAGMVTGADGNLWFTEAGGDAISSIKSDGTGYTTHSLISDGFGVPITDTLGPDGNVWFGDCTTNQVGKITTSGTITTYTGQSDEGIITFAAGLDGNIWFSECFGATGGSVGAINTTTGTLNEIAVPNGGAPYPVALGPDGSVWYGDIANFVLGHISSGSATSFAPLTNNEPTAMTAGSDGAIWFTETNFIGRMTTAGVLSPAPQYNLTMLVGGTPNTNFITAGPDGALWFADGGNDAIGRITTSGAVTEYPVPTIGANPVGIAVGPDGNIWFTENATDKIGVLKL
jgi:virginiamycin B lyase